MADPLVDVRDVVKDFQSGRRSKHFSSNTVRAVDHVSFEVRRGETFGLVGESGSGKSTLARCLLALERVDNGTVSFDGADLTSLARGDLQRLRRRMQMVFQDPYSSLDPRMTVRRIVEEGLEIHGIGDRVDRSTQMLSLVGISGEQLQRRPHALSGGQLQRVAIARALVLDPDLVVLDEAVSALDVSVRAQVLNLLMDLRDRLNLTYVFIVHDLLLAEYFCDRVAVMYRGAVVEMATSKELFANPLHPYTVSLFSATPGRGEGAQRARVLLKGEASVFIPGQAGCRFRTRCPIGHDREICADQEPPLAEQDGSHPVACHFAGEFSGLDERGLPS